MPLPRKINIRPPSLRQPVPAGPGPLVPEDDQRSLFPEEQARRKEHDLELVIDRLRGKYGYAVLRRTLALLDPALDLDAKGEHVIHPIGFLGTLDQS